MSRRKNGRPMSGAERKRAWRERSKSAGLRAVLLHLQRGAADRLREDAKAAGISMSELVGRAVDEGKTAEVAEFIIDESDVAEARAASAKADELLSRKQPQK